MRVWRPESCAAALAARDPRVAAIVEAVGVPAIRTRPSTFDAIARSIAYQQLTGKAAGTIWGRVLDLFPDRRATVEGTLALSEAKLRGAGLSRAKVLAIRDLAAHIQDGRVKPRSLWRMSDEEVVDTLVQVRGIGPWSAHMHLMFSLRRPDIWPTGDLGVRKGLQRIFRTRATPDAARSERLGRPFVGHRTTLAWYCWRALELPT